MYSRAQSAELSQHRGSLHPLVPADVRRGVYREALRPVSLWTAAGFGQDGSGGEAVRRLRIEALPQSFNVSGGALTMVGPCPGCPAVGTAFEKHRPGGAPSEREGGQ